MTASPRIAALVDRFRAIGEANMRGLPIYNDALEVEAVGFAPMGEGGADLLGVLVTPWFMNLILLPAEPAPATAHGMGDKMETGLPCGPTPMRWGGDAEIGGYRFVSLHSPMGAFHSQEHARAEANLLFGRYLTPPEPEVAEPEVAEAGQAEPTDAPPAAKGLDRRAFFGGRARG